MLLTHHLEIYKGFITGAPCQEQGTETNIYFLLSHRYRDRGKVLSSGSKLFLSHHNLLFPGLAVPSMTFPWWDHQPPSKVPALLYVWKLLSSRLNGEAQLVLQWQICFLPSLFFLAQKWSAGKKNFFTRSVPEENVSKRKVASVTNKNQTAIFGSCQYFSDYVYGTLCVSYWGIRAEELVTEIKCHSGYIK